MLGGNSEYLAKQEMRKQGYDDALIALADSYADTDDEIVLSARKLYRTLVENYSKETKEERVRVVEAGGPVSYTHLDVYKRQFL